jgi:hypothetical protein
MALMLSIDPPVDGAVHLMLWSAEPRFTRRQIDWPTT